MIIRSPKELAIFVRNYRKQQKISQASASSSVGLKQSTISAFENEPSSTKLDTLFRILSAVNMEIHLTPKDGRMSIEKEDTWDEEW